jgi:hypothetical protein
MQLALLILILVGGVASASTDDITKEIADYQGVYSLSSASSDRCPSRIDLRLEKNSEYWVLQTGGKFFMSALGSEKKWKERDCIFSVKTDWSPSSNKSALISEESIKCMGKVKRVITKILELRQSAVNLFNYESVEKAGRTIASVKTFNRTVNSTESYECSLDFLGPPKNIKTDLKVAPIKE